MEETSAQSPVMSEPGKYVTWVLLVELVISGADCKLELLRNKRNTQLR